MLTRIRTAIQENQTGEFPTAAIEQAMAQVGKRLAFDEIELEEVFASRYGTARALPP